MRVEAPGVGLVPLEEIQQARPVFLPSEDTANPAGGPTSRSTCWHLDRAVSPPLELREISVCHVSPSLWDFLTAA